MIPAQDFDIFGLMGFVIMFYISVKIINNKKLKKYGYLLLLISILGFIADSYTVLTNFILK
jgi:hypothetical protein